MATTRVATIEKAIPFGDYLYWWLQLPEGQSLKSLVGLSYRYERQYLAWEEVRKGRNPYFENGTGFEGYFVGSCATADEALAKIVTVGREMLTNLSALHRYEPRYRSRMLKALTENTVDLKAISEWSAELGAILARLRCNLTYNSRAAAFHEETYQIIRGLPPIDYTEHDHHIVQHYMIANHGILTPRMLIDAATLKPSEQEPWLVAESVGKFGHPLIREFINFSVS